MKIRNVSVDRATASEIVDVLYLLSSSLAVQEESGEIAQKAFHLSKVLDAAVKESRK